MLLEYGSPPQQPTHTRPRSSTVGRALVQASLLTIALFVVAVPGQGLHSSVVHPTECGPVEVMFPQIIEEYDAIRNNESEWAEQVQSHYGVQDYHVEEDSIYVATEPLVIEASESITIDGWLLSAWDEPGYGNAIVLKAPTVRINGGGGLAAASSISLWLHEDVLRTGSEFPANIAWNNIPGGETVGGLITAAYAETNLGANLHTSPSSLRGGDGGSIVIIAKNFFLDIGACIATGSGEGGLSATLELGGGAGASTVEAGGSGGGFDSTTNTLRGGDGGAGGSLHFVGVLPVDVFGTVSIGNGGSGGSSSATGEPIGIGAPILTMGGAGGPSGMIYADGVLYHTVASIWNLAGGMGGAGGDASSALTGEILTLDGPDGGDDVDTATCGRDGPDGTDGDDGNDGRTSDEGHVATDGEPGRPGVNGYPGVPGGDAVAEGGPGNLGLRDGGAGGSATAAGGCGGKGGTGGTGGNGGRAEKATWPPVYQGCHGAGGNGGNGIKGKKGGDAEATGGPGGDGLIRYGGDGGGASATSGRGGNGGDGGDAGSGAVSGIQGIPAFGGQSGAVAAEAGAPGFGPQGWGDIPNPEMDDPGGGSLGEYGDLGDGWGCP